MSYAKILKGQLDLSDDFIVDNLQYETLAGSHSYGVANEDSDLDVMGFTIPPIEMVFPHMAGEILDFGRQKNRFNQFQQHHLVCENIADVDNDRWVEELPAEPSPIERVDVDMTVYNIVRFFHLAMDNNPNVLELLFTPDDCVTYLTKVASRVRECADIFLHKGSFHRFMGFAKSQIHKLNKRDRSDERLRKYAYHAVRLTLELEDILNYRRLRLDTHVDELTAVRRGEWSFNKVLTFVDKKMNELELQYDNEDAPLPHSPDEPEIKGLLLECLEEFYGHIPDTFNSI